MPLSRPELDVLLVGHASFGEIGGLTSWARGLAAELPGQRIGAIGVSGRPTELPAARIYHAMTPAAAESVLPLARREGRPVILTCHAMNEHWRPEGWRGPDPLDASGPGGDPGKGPGKDSDDDHDRGGGNDDRDDRDRDRDRDRDGDRGRDRDRGRRGRAYVDAAVIVAVSAAVAESHIAAGAPGDRTFVIPNGVALAPLAVHRPAEPLVGFVGRLAPVKGIERLLRAMRAVRSELPDARLVLIGPDDGPPGYADTLRRMADAPGLRGAVRFAGADRPERWYPRLACLALASETEGMPMAVLEAMSHGVPCIVPRVGGCAEAVGDAGIVVAPRDTDALAGAIAALLGDSRSAARLGALARERASSWTASDAAAAYSELYRTVTV